MFQPNKLLILLSAMFMLALMGCSSESSSTTTSDDKTSPTTAADRDTDDAHDDDSDHDHGSDGDNHSHAGQTPDDDGADSSSEPGPTVVTIDGVTLEVSLSGTFTAGGLIDFFVLVTDGPMPTTLRLWVGEASGEGSLKTRAVGHDDHFHDSVEVPDSIGENAAFWIEIESETGERIAGAIPLPSS